MKRTSCKSIRLYSCSNYLSTCTHGLHRLLGPSPLRAAPQHEPDAPQVALQPSMQSRNMCCFLHLATTGAVCKPSRLATSLTTTANRCRYL
eukprot:COSAG01_NODE_4996_length_4559_cov_1.847309_2_plen_91_part_00